MQVKHKNRYNKKSHKYIYTYVYTGQHARGVPLFLPVLQIKYYMYLCAVLAQKAIRAVPIAEGRQKSVANSNKRLRGRNT